MIIPPTLLGLTYYFAAVPIYESEPVPPPPANPAGDGDGGAGPLRPPAAVPLGDADGVNDQVATRLVFKGYKWVPMPSWEAESNPDYEVWIENRDDNDAERQRQDQRARSAVRPNPHAATGLDQPGSAPAAPIDTE